MPKISEAQRQARRDQILAAVWPCFLRKGIHGTSMEDLICESGLSAGAVYLYFRGKDELIQAAIASYMGQLRGLLQPLLGREEVLAPAPFVHGMMAALARHTKRTGIDLNSVILMGWSEAQTNRTIAELVTTGQRKYREGLTEVVRQWQRRKYVRADANPVDVAKTLLAFFLGSIAQEALLGGTNPATLTRGFETLLGAKVPPTRPPVRSGQRRRAAGK